MDDDDDGPGRYRKSGMYDDDDAPKQRASAGGTYSVAIVGGFGGGILAGAVLGVAGIMLMCRKPKRQVPSRDAPTLSTMHMSV